MAAASLEPGKLDMLLTVELVSGLLDGTVFDAEPVVAGAPVPPTFNRTVPSAARHCVAFVMTGATVAPGADVGGGGVV